MAAKKMPGRKTPKEVKRMKKIFDDKLYHEEYDSIAYDILSKSHQAEGKSHVCARIGCSRETLYRWMRLHPTFAKAINKGLEEGKSNFLKKVSEHAFSPKASVNNGLIKLLLNHTYGVRDEPDNVVVVNNNITNNLSAKEALEQRGIPEPDISLEDIDNG